GMARLRGRPLRGEGSGNESASIGSKIVTPSVKVTLSCGNVRAVQRIRVAKFKSSQPTKRWAGDWYDCIRPRGNNPRPLCALRLTGVSFRTESLPVIELMVEFDTIISSAALALHARLYEFFLHQVVEDRDSANVFGSRIRKRGRPRLSAFPFR